MSLAKLAKNEYTSGDGRIRLMCSVSAAHDDTKDGPRFWFGFHVGQQEFLKGTEVPYVCLGCGSADNTLLVPLASILGSLDSMSMSAEAQHRHLDVRVRRGRFVLRLLNGKDGPDLTDFKIGSAATGQN